jgi:hypothetical protein
MCAVRLAKAFARGEFGGRLLPVTYCIPDADDEAGNAATTIVASTWRDEGKCLFTDEGGVVRPPCPKRLASFLDVHVGRACVGILPVNRYTHILPPLNVFDVCAVEAFTTIQCPKRFSVLWSACVEGRGPAAASTIVRSSMREKRPLNVSELVDDPKVRRYVRGLLRLQRRRSAVDT